MQVNANGIRTNFFFDGPESAPVVLCSHSLATHLDMWWPQHDLLRQGFRLLCYDTRGHGGSDAPGGAYTLTNLADDALGLMDALEIETAHWMGISMGGMIGQQFALRYPQRLESLIICDSMAQFPAAAADVWSERIRIAESRGMAPLVEPTLERWFSPDFAKSNPEAIDRIVRMIEATPVSGYVGCSLAITELSLLEQLGQIGLPTLVIVGEHDSGTPVSASRDIQERITGARLEILPGARHLTNIESAPAFNRLIGDFLARL